MFCLSIFIISSLQCNANNKKGVSNESGQDISIEVTIDSTVKLASVECDKTTDKHEGNKQRQQKPTESQISNDDEIEKQLDKIFNEDDTAKNTIYQVPTDYNELKRTFSGEFEKQAQLSIEICQTSGVQRTTEETNVGKIILLSSLEGSEGIIIDSPDSAGQLLNNIIQPVHSTPLESSTKLTETLSAAPHVRTSQHPEITGRIPPSPNLFQSSGETDPKSTQSQQIEARAPETVYVPCKHSMTFHTEEKNLTTLSFDQISDNTDPFAGASTNQEDTMVEGINATTLPTPDPNIVVKQGEF